MYPFITGSTGFLGRRLVRALREDGIPVRCLVRGSSDISSLRDFVGAELWDGVDLVQSDLNDVPTIQRLMDGCDTVYHVAAALAGSTAVMFLNTVIPTRRIIDAALANQVRRFVMVSSLGVYGVAGLKTWAMLDETSPVDPTPHLRDPYTYSKIAQEAVAWEAYRDHKLPLVVIRPGVIFGEGRGVLSNRVGLKVGPLLLRMGGSQTMPYTYVENCAAALRCAGLTPGIEGEVFNVLDDGLPTGKGLLKMYRRAGQKVRTLWLPRPAIGPASSLYEWYSRWSQGQLPGVITRYKSDSMWKAVHYTNTKAKTRLGWTPPVPFEEAFRRSVSQPT
jgi:nucleoside-diphosphate-sugar epimerase